jgi:hypothetical protein
VIVHVVGHNVELFGRPGPDFVVFVAIVEGALTVVHHVQVSAAGINWKEGDKKQLETIHSQR